MWHVMFWFTVVCILLYNILKQLQGEGSHKVKFYLKYFIYFFIGIFLITLLLPKNLLKPKNPRNLKLFTRTFIHVAKLLDVTFQIRDEKFLDEDRGAVIICNHQSSLDCLGMCKISNAVQYLITVIMKMELFYIWPAGLSTYLAGVIFINRNNSKSAYKELHKTKDLIANKKLKVIIYPEGTRNKNYTKLLPFKKGAFNLAVEAQVPIIPIVFSPYYFLNKEKCIFNKGHIVIQCLEPVSTEGLTKDDVPQLLKICYDKMTVACNQLFQEFGSADL